MAHDLTPFKELNKTKVPWAERLKLIHKQFPNTVNFNWKHAFDDDPTLLGRIIGDIVKADQAEPGRPGKRAAVDRDVAEKRLRQLMGDDYTSMPFGEALRMLSGGRSIRHIAAKTGLNRNTVHRLMEGTMAPDAWMMEQVAKAFQKKPGYFAEYRTAYITAVISARLETYPESSVSLYRKLR